MQDSEGNNLVTLPPVSIPISLQPATDPFQGGYDRCPRCAKLEGKGRLIATGLSSLNANQLVGTLRRR